MKRMSDFTITGVCYRCSTEGEPPYLYRTSIDAVSNSYSALIELAARPEPIPSVFDLVGTSISEIEHIVDTDYATKNNVKLLSTRQESVIVHTDLGDFPASEVIFSRRFILHNIKKVWFAPGGDSTATFELFDLHKQKSLYAKAYCSDETFQRAIDIFRRDMPVVFDPTTGRLDLENLVFDLEFDDQN